jgi:ribosome-associated protein
MIRITDNISISENEVQESFIRASGPGGQNVNKVASAVQIRFDAASSPAISQVVLQRLKTIAGSRLTKDGVIVLIGKRFRSQLKNREDILQRLVSLLQAALKPDKKRMRTRPSLASKRRISDAKRQRSDVKKQRGKPRTDDG